MIKVFYNCIAHLNIAAFNCNFVRLAESFFWHFIQYGVPGDYVSFLFFLLWWLVCVFILNTYVAYFLYFCFHYWYYWVLGDPSLLLSLKFQSSFFSFKRKSVIAFFCFSINCFSEVDTLFLGSSAPKWESPTWHWE